MQSCSRRASRDESKLRPAPSPHSNTPPAARQQQEQHIHEVHLHHRHQSWARSIRRWALPPCLFQQSRPANSSSRLTHALVIPLFSKQHLHTSYSTASTSSHERHIQVQDGASIRCAFPSLMPSGVLDLLTPCCVCLYLWDMHILSTEKRQAGKRISLCTSMYDIDRLTVLSIAEAERIRAVGLPLRSPTLSRHATLPESNCRTDATSLRTRRNTATASQSFAKSTRRATLLRLTRRST